MSIVRFVGYTRVSTRDQATDGVSLDAQAERIRGFVTSKGYDPDVDLELFSDAGVSGSSRKNRPGLAAALERAEDHGGQFVAYSLSRLARSTEDAIAIAKRLAKGKCELVLLSESVDTSSASGKVFFTMLAAFAQFESDLCSERTKAAMAHKRSRHERISRHTPYGWDLVDGRQLVENDVERDVVRYMKELRAGGGSFRSIARNLALRGIKTKQGNATWAPTTVKQVVERKNA